MLAGKILEENVDGILKETHGARRWIIEPPEERVEKARKALSPGMGKHRK